jgi:HAD superfamily phosphoserine phosphatase-like hydrolase
MICAQMPLPDDAPAEVKRSLEDLCAVFRRSAKAAGRTQKEAAEAAAFSRYPVSRMFTGKWCEPTSFVPWKTAEVILRIGLLADEDTVVRARVLYDSVNGWLQSGAVDQPTATSLRRYGRSLVGHEGRQYPSIDRLELEVGADGSVAGTIVRIEPEGRRGATWRCSGRFERDRYLLTFWPAESALPDAPQVDSSGHMTILRESSSSRPWPGAVMKMRRGPNSDPILEAYDYWWTGPNDPVLTSAASAVAVLDFDNTLAAGWILGPWLRRLAGAGIGDAAEAVAQLAQLFENYETKPGYGHDTLSADAASVYAAALRGVHVDAISPLIKPFVADYLGPRGAVFSHARPLIKGLRSRGYRPVLITGAPAELTAEIISALDIERCFPLVLEIADGRFTGRIVRNRGVSTEKAAACDYMRDEHESDIAIAIGDSQGDVPMWTRARTSIAIGTSDVYQVTIPGVNLNEPLDTSFWDRVPPASWLTLVRPEVGA